MSVMEMSHRSKPFETILAQAQSGLKELLSIPDDYDILFLQGGASQQFTMIPLDFLNPGKSADYVVTGTWGSKAVESAKLLAPVDVVYNGKPEGYRTAPDWSMLNFNKDAAYAHFTSNETIQGVEFHKDPTCSIPVICDMSSDILSRKVDVSKYSLIYAGAQKNMGPAGVTAVILKKDMLSKLNQNLAPTLDYKVQADNNSMYNTPPCWSIYLCSLVYQNLLVHEGVEGANKRNNAKANLLYNVIDSCGGFYKGHADQKSRSIMNVTFTLPSEELTIEFVKQCTADGMDGLKGHRSVGGCRASLYNAFPLEGCQKLADAMVDFAKKKG